MTLPPLPMTVVGGYLGAGKTTLINRLLAEPHGRKLLVMVNDFGAINVDADLLASKDEDTIALTNGCVCCTMGADLFMAIGDVLDRRPRPDHLVIEASGIGYPAKISNLALAEPDLAYAGTIVLIDGDNFIDLHRDKLVGAQISEQAAQADILAVSKRDAGGPLRRTLSRISAAPAVDLNAVGAVSALFFDAEPGLPRDAGHADDPGYASAHFAGRVGMTRDEFVQFLRQRPAAIFRVKGGFRDREGASWTVQAVGSKVALTPARDILQTSIVCIAPGAGADAPDIAKWWLGGLGGRFVASDHAHA